MPPQPPVYLFPSRNQSQLFISLLAFLCLLLLKQQLDPLRFQIAEVLFFKAVAFSTAAADVSLN